VLGVGIGNRRYEETSMILSGMLPSDEKMSNGPFSVLNYEQMSNWLAVERQPVNIPSGFLTFFL